jgi:hypothetical protein
MLARIVLAWVGASIPVSLVVGAMLYRAGSGFSGDSYPSLQPAPTAHGSLTPAA